MYQGGGNEQGYLPKLRNRNELIDFAVDVQGLDMQSEPTRNRAQRVPEMRRGDLQP